MCSTGTAGCSRSGGRNRQRPGEGGGLELAADGRLQGDTACGLQPMPSCDDSCTAVVRNDRHGRNIHRQGGMIVAELG